jgi:hypothetical protein
MKRLEKRTSNAGAIRVEFDPAEYKRFSDNLFTALRKFGSGKKTRAVHKLIEKKSVVMGVFTGEAANALVIPAMKNSTLHYMLMSSTFFDDSIGSRGAVGIAVDRLHLDKKIKEEETFVNEARLHKIEKLKENYEELTTKYLNSIDYIKTIDGIYFGWLLALSYHTIANESPTRAKIVTVAADILADILKKLYQQVNKIIDSEIHQLIEAIAIYFIRIYYMGETASYALSKMKRAFNDDILDAISRAKVNNAKEFSDVSLILSGTELLPITPKTFDMQMERMFGKLAYSEYIQPSLATFIAVMANLAQPNQLFKDSYPVNEELHHRLEELILNEQKFVTIKENG